MARGFFFLEVFLAVARALSPAHEFFCSRKLRLAPRPSARVFFGSRKLRLAPQAYSPWTPRSDRFLVRSYAPASRHPRCLDLVGLSQDVVSHVVDIQPVCSD